jgi:hypothetical protein
MEPLSALPDRVLMTILLDTFHSPLPVVAAVRAAGRPKAVTRGEPSMVETSP